jgi:hypothetical protein
MVGFARQERGRSQESEPYRVMVAAYPDLTTEAYSAIIAPSSRQGKSFAARAVSPDIGFATGVLRGLGPVAAHATGILQRDPTREGL